MTDSTRKSGVFFTDLMRKIGVFFTDLTRKIGVFYRLNAKNWRFSVQILFSKNFASVKKMTNMRYVWHCGLKRQKVQTFTQISDWSSQALSKRDKDSGIVAKQARSFTE